MVNRPGGHQQSLMPATSRWPPAFPPLKSKGTIVLGSSPRVADPTRWQPSRPDAIRMNEQIGLAKRMVAVRRSASLGMLRAIICELNNTALERLRCQETKGLKLRRVWREQWY